MKVEPVTADGITYVAFKCPGCHALHQIQTPGWMWNQSLDKPTFRPSVLVTYPANPDAIEEFREWRTERRCHSFITDGRVQFLSDCTHQLAGKTVDLPEID